MFRLRNLAIALLLLLSACDKCDSALSYVGLTNTPAPAAVEIDVMCDYGGAPCSPERLRTIADAAFSRTALRPGSHVRLWWLGNSVGETSLLASVTIPASRGTSLRARDAHRTHVIDEGRKTFEQASAPLFAGFTRKRSPILESIGKIAKWVQSMMTPHPIGVYLQPILLTGARERIKHKIYMRTTGYHSPRFDACRDTARNNGWIMQDITCAHDMMIDEPELLANILTTLAATPLAARRFREVGQFSDSRRFHATRRPPAGNE